jgi:hypothetical protein
VCLGAQAAAANKAAKRNYEFKLKQREADWMQKVSNASLANVQYSQGIDNSNLALAGVYANAQEKYGQLIGEAMQNNQESWKTFLQEAKGGAKLAASGQTGVSAERLSALDLAEYLRTTSKQAWELTKAKSDLDVQTGTASAQAKADQLQMFSKVAFEATPELEPPKPVYQSVAGAAFTQLLGIAAPLIGSDIKLKENIKKIGTSISGLNVYKFNYKNHPKKYIGVMAHEVQKIKPEAVETMDSGFLGVKYDQIDVEFKEAN